MSVSNSPRRWHGVNKLTWIVTVLLWLSLVLTEVEATWKPPKLGFLTRNRGGAATPFLGVVDYHNKQKEAAATLTDNTLSPAAQVLQQYLADTDESSNARSSPRSTLRHHYDHFYIHGWRWHTLSVVRQARALSRVPWEFVDVNDFQKAARFVVDFNLRGLQHIEQKVFFPWLKSSVKAQLLKKGAPQTVTRALESVVHQLEQDQKAIRKLGNELMSTVSNLDKSPQDNQDTLCATMARQSALIADRTQSMMDTETTVLIPLVARTMSKRQQESLNQAVIQSLGMWNSRLHLVSMQQALLGESPEERVLFARSIPKLAQRMIPRWKRLLYDPQMSILQDL